jgi:hypothetical protein
VNECDDVRVTLLELLDLPGGEGDTDAVNGGLTLTAITGGGLLDRNGHGHDER